MIGRLLFLASAPASSAGSPGWFLGFALGTWRDDTCRVSRRRRRTLRRDPELNLQFRQTSTINYHDTTGIDAARIDQVVLGTICALQTFRTAAAVANDIALGSGLVL